jgi:hypothetical protein
MSNENDLENLEIETDKKEKKKNGKKKEENDDVKTSISIPTSVRDKIYYNKGAAHSYGDFIDECIDAWMKAKNIEDATPKSKRKA